jgi:acyl-CoA synthetase (NDP forming)
MISQSGGIANDFGHEARLAGLGMSKVVSFGNGCDVDAIALLEYLADDPETEYIAAYIEGVRDARLFLETLKRTTARKPVVVWKGGLTPLGSRATVSHTGSLGGEAKIWNGALAQAGAIQVQGLDALIDALVALKYTRSRGKRIALVGGGGAIGVFSSDLAYQWGLSVPEFSSTTQAKLRQSFPTPGNSVKNPLDTGSPAIPLGTLKSLIGDVLHAEPIDVLILVMLLHPLEVVSNTFMKTFGFPPQPGGAFFKGLPEALATLKSETGKDVMVVLENRTCRLEDADVEKVNREQRMLFQHAGIPVFADVHRALRGIRFAAERK